MFEFKDEIICPEDHSATPERIAQYKEYYKIKYDLCKAQQPKVIAEIGVRAGYSAWTFLQACPEAKYIGFDPNNGTHGGQGGEDGKFSRWASDILDEYGYNYELWSTDTQKVDHIGIENVDLFHVDGDHTTKGVQHDLDLAFEAISDTGLIVVDDITYIPSVKLGVDTWLAKMEGKVTSTFVESLRGEILIKKVL